MQLREPRQDPGAHLKIPDIDTDRMLLHIHGKGKKDRLLQVANILRLHGPVYRAKLAR